MITRFKDEYEFLDTFHIHPFIYNGVEYPTVQHAYQCSKCLDVKDAETILRYGPYDANKLGNIFHRKKNWSNAKYNVMFEILFAKLSSQPFADKLIATGRQFQVDVQFNDKRAHWSYIPGMPYVGNYYGKLLMLVRYALTDMRFNYYDKDLIDSVVNIAFDENIF